MKKQALFIILMVCAAMLALRQYPGVQQLPAVNARNGLGIAPAAADPGATPPVTEGTLRILDPKGQPAGECPLRHTDVHVEIAGFLARVDVTQQFHNPTKEKIEAVYVFPLSASGAVDDMTLRVGSRTIRGEIKRREEARRIYEEAREAGHVAALLDQERPNIFTQSVANIMPGESVEVRLRYVETLAYDEGNYKFAFPMVVGPRYIPGAPAGRKGAGWAPDTNQAPDASRITPPVTPEGTRAGHDISLTVDLDAALPVAEISSPLHEITVQKQGETRARISLAQKNTIPNKDFILTYRTAGNEISDALLTHAGKDGKYFTLILQPPARVTPAQIAPKEMIFVIDTSGSQMGWPIEKAKETMKRCIAAMHPNDTFNLLAFSNDVVRLFEKPAPNTPENREKALRFLGERLGSGGTEMLKAIDAALLPPADPERLRVVCFMTDGYVGNDMEILNRVQEHRGTARFFSFGVGNSVNRFLLDKMAELGRGEVEYVTLETPGAAAAARFAQRIASPVLTDISVDWGNLPVADLYPQAIPDLFAARPLILKGRYTHPGSGTITLRGKVGGKPYSRRIQVSLPDQEPAHAALGGLWARARIDHLMNQDWQGIQQGQPKEAVREEITRLGLDYRLMTQYTSFVAVEERVVTEGGKPRTVAVPVEMPEGVSYQGVFGDGATRLRAGRAITKALGGGFAGAAVNEALPALAAANPRREAAAAPAMPVPAPSQSDKLLIAKLDPALRALLASPPAGARSRRVKVIVLLNIFSARTLTQLRALGFALQTRDAAGQKVAGSIPATRLEALARLPEVHRVLSMR